MANKLRVSKSGSGAPTAITPDFLGQIYIDEDTGTRYEATALTEGSWVDKLSLKENVANKKTSLTDNSDTYYPTQKAVKTAVDAKQDTLTFGIANTNAVKVDDATVADNDYAKFTANGIEGVPYSTVLSDIGALANVVEDTTPQLGGNLDGNDKNITGLGSVGFTQELDNGSKTSSFSVDFSTDQKQKVTLTAKTLTLTFDTTNIKVGNYTLKIVNGGLATLTWAAESGSILWAGGTEPTLTSSGTDILAIYFDGTNFYCVASLDFKAAV